MEKLGLFVMLLDCCFGMRVIFERADTSKDLFGRMFTFPEQTNTTHVLVDFNSPKDHINATTVCLRFFTDSCCSSSLFSLAVPDQANSILLWRDNPDVYSMYVNDQGATFSGLKSELSQWNSICATWETATGLSQVWLNGKPSPRKLVSPGYSITWLPSIVLGQEQDSYGGSFDASQSFVGSMTDVYMWDFVLSPKEIQYYMTRVVVRPGIVNWRHISLTNVDAVVEETGLLNL